MYRQTLEGLREQLFKVEEPTQEPQKKGGIIPMKMASKPLEEAKLPAYGDWLKTISSMASDLRNSSDTQHTGASGFVEGFSQTVSLKSKKEKEADKALAAVPEENKESFIKKRGDGPSYYAPRASAEPGSLIGLIDKTEGGGDYDTLFGFSNRDGKKFAGTKISQMTIGELKEFANGEYGKWSREQLGYKATPMGRYQFVGTTMASVAKEMGLPDDTVFSPEVQDAMFEYHAKKTIAGGKTMDQKISLLREQWEGFKHVDRDTLASAVMKYGA
jgi:hypothetical protein